MQIALKKTTTNVTGVTLSAMRFMRVINYLFFPQTLYIHLSLLEALHRKYDKVSILPIVFEYGNHNGAWQRKRAYAVNSKLS